MGSVEVQKTESENLTETEREYFDALAQYDTIKNAAEGLKVSPQTLYNFLYNLKKKYSKRRGWINSVIAQKKRSSLIRNVLSERVEILEPAEEDEAI
jgi:FixJ family two-component response regulator